MRGNRRGNAAHRALLLRTLPLRRHDHLAGARASPPADAPEARAPRHCHLTGAGFLGKPLRAIFRFRHQDAQTPPSPLVGEGGRGDEGQQARECSTPRIAPENSTLEKALPPRGCAGLPARRRAGGAITRASTRLMSHPRPQARRRRAPRYCHLTGAGFLGKPLRAIFRFRHQDAQTPPSPLV
jgi:hypothetical protein